MPSDLAIYAVADPIHVCDRAGIGLPFSKGIMATSILATGVETDVAYRIASEIGAELRAARVTEIDPETLVERAANAVRRVAGEQAALDYLAWRQVKRSGRPLVIVLAGTSGVGKSTLATRLSLRLGINRVLTTDAIRDVLRTVIPDAVLPDLHRSTYECVASEADERTGLASFSRQAHAVASASVAVAARLATEGRSVILEGVHLLPGRIRTELADHPAAPLVVEMVLGLSDASLHRARLEHRQGEAPGRDSTRHLAHFRSIRLIQEELHRMAAAHGIPRHDVTHPEDLTQHLVHLAVGALESEGKAA